MKSSILYKCIPPVLILLSLALSIIIRICNVSNPEGKLLIIGGDSARIVRQAKLISQNGHLPERDGMRSFPVGRVINNPTFLPYLIAWLHKFFALFIPHLTLEQFSIFYPVLFFALACFVFYFLVKRLLNKNIALLAVNIIAVPPILVGRTMAGYADHDALCLFYRVFLHITSTFEHINRKKIVCRLLLLLVLSWQLLGLPGKVFSFLHWLL